MAGVGQRSKERANILRDYVEKAKKYEDEKDFATLKFAEYLYEVKKNNAQVAQGYNEGGEGFKQFCGEYLRTGYHSAQSYIRIHNMVTVCAIDPAEAEDIGYSKLRTITPITRPDNVNMILEQAKNLNTNELEEFVKQYKKQMESGAPGDDEKVDIVAKRFVFPAADEEVTIIQSTLADVKGLLNNPNETAALVHIMQAYMEFVYMKEREEVLSQKIGKKSEKAEKPETKEKPEIVEEPETSDIISESELPTASLPELLAFAKFHEINIPTSIQSNKPKVKTLIIEHLAAAIPEAEVSVTEEAVEKAADTVDSLEPFEQNVPEVKEDKPKKKAEKADKAPKEKKVKEKEPEAPEIEDPADIEGEAAALTIEEAITEIRSVPDKKALKAVAKSWRVTISEKDFKKVDIEELIEFVVKAVCEANDEEYIPPTEEDNSDLDDMLAGE